MVINRTNKYGAIHTALEDAVPSDTTVVASFSPDKPHLPCLVFPMLDIFRNSVTTGKMSTHQSIVTITLEAFVTNTGGQGAAKIAAILDAVEDVFTSHEVSGLYVSEVRPLSLERFALNKQTILTAGIEIDVGVSGA